MIKNVLNNLILTVVLLPIIWGITLFVILPTKLIVSIGDVIMILFWSPTALYDGVKQFHKDLYDY